MAAICWDTLSKRKFQRDVYPCGVMVRHWLTAVPFQNIPAGSEPRRC